MSASSERKLLTKKLTAQTPSSDSKSFESKAIKVSRKKVSSIDDQLEKVKDIIKEILKQQSYGLSLQKLQNFLSLKLGYDFDTRVFGCQTFYDFLMNYADHLVDIEDKRDGKIIYAKNERFGAQTIINMLHRTDNQQQDDRSESNKTPSKSSGSIPFFNFPPYSMQSPPAFDKPTLESGSIATGSNQN
mmetsp:Transcript_41450/g.36818  ORF Transcript_41450/g.36818 Transcript_41450/m.36818 type:complete len:188 (+) Transcript_41450:2553-3116(+)|eukprot:CAMPEP_0114580618 /NCGR_PEP_ID=MMETSP0125-20121206/4863_1 /TAXON_ID=485358 ORGANISM="Aristerostoma sp., Strain ATCC 50986" /NCGR_SAMPLE_ID=MMETSP0125 /ASSEMBLY_ACC=CAM_ASM_000245 /LENGTH=187 /DNA_ID=CAMNT_0001772279 /DNA_START=2511 /DNA_END=3074 /DNA_ORIENTATION=-